MSILFSHLTDISYKKMLLFLILKFLGLIGIILNTSSKAFLCVFRCNPKRESEEKIIKWGKFTN